MLGRLPLVFDDSFQDLLRWLAALPDGAVVLPCVRNCSHKRGALGPCVGAPMGDVGALEASYGVSGACADQGAALSSGVAGSPVVCKSGVSMGSARALGAGREDCRARRLA